MKKKQKKDEKNEKKALRKFYGKAFKQQLHPSVTVAWRQTF